MSHLELVLSWLHVVHFGVASGSSYATHVVVITQYPHIATLSPMPTPAEEKRECCHSRQMLKYAYYLSQNQLALASTQCICIPVFHNPIWHSIVRAIAHNEHGMVQCVSTASIIIENSTGIELVGEAGRIHSCTVLRE